MLLQHELGDLSGLDAMVVGRSNIVGKPMAQLLVQRQLHRDRRPFADQRPARRRYAARDIVVAAVGRPEMVRGDWLKPGATVIDVGQERVEQAGRQLASCSATSRSMKRWRSPGPSLQCPAASGR